MTMNNITLSILASIYHTSVRQLLLAALPKEDSNGRLIKPSVDEFKRAQSLPAEFDRHFGQAVELTGGGIEWSSKPNSLIGAYYDQQAELSMMALQAKSIMQAEGFRGGAEGKASYILCHRARATQAERDELPEGFMPVEELDSAVVKAAVLDAELDVATRTSIAQFAASQLAYTARFVATVVRRTYRDFPQMSLVSGPDFIGLAHASFACRDTGEVNDTRHIDHRTVGGKRLDEQRPDIGHEAVSRAVDMLDDIDFDWDAALDGEGISGDSYTLDEFAFDSIRSNVQRMRVWGAIVAATGGEAAVEREASRMRTSAAAWAARNRPSRDDGARIRLAS